MVACDSVNWADLPNVQAMQGAQFSARKIQRSRPLSFPVLSAEVLEYQEMQIMKWVRRICVILVL